MIDFNRINNSIIHYESFGFKRIETPWLVTEYIDSITRPINVEPYIVEAKKKNLIASGEQGFLYLYLKEYLPKGKFQTVTPCFRNDSFDLTHTKYFIKNELIDTEDLSEGNLLYTIDIAQKFFDKELDIKTDIVKDGDGYDIMYGDYELGSYGIRQCEFLQWMYGTGCAEPRMTTIKNLIK